MKKAILNCLLILLFGGIVTSSVWAAAGPPTPPVLPLAVPSQIPCPVFTCPIVKDANGQDQQVFCDASKGDKWVRDDDVTALGKGGDRARQFVFWTLNTTSFDTSTGIRGVWATSRNIVYFLLFIVAILMGLGIVIGQRSNFDFKVKIWPLVIKLAMLLLYVTFSYVLVVLIVQLSDILMQFFIKGLGGDKIFNIYFSNGANSVDNYRNFIGCSNTNPSSLESLNTSKFLVWLTNMTYYAVGIALILRKIVLWFLITVAPFLAILTPFMLIRNTGWIWIGVFFQWVFYGPLFGLFLGGMARIWNSPTHIPFQFIFSKAGKLSEIVYPTAINILYAGPSQRADVLNSSNYVDTFAEYIISLIMLWVVILLPWLLLRIFQDYCCDGIYAMKNILLSMYDNMTPPAGPTPGPTPSPRSSMDHGVAMRLDKDQDVKTHISTETIQDIKRSRTEDITSSLDLKATKLTDIARFETNRQVRENVTKNIEYLQNPLKASTPSERQKYMSVRTELFERATKGDQVARQTLAALSTSKFEQVAQRDKIMQSITQPAQVVRSVAFQVATQTGIPQEKTVSIVKNIYNTVTNNARVVESIVKESQLNTSQVQSVLNKVSTSESIARESSTVVSYIAKETGIAEIKVKEVLSQTSKAVERESEMVKQIAQKENVTEGQVSKVMMAHVSAVVSPVAPIESKVTIPQTVSIEDYEEVKGMWADQYEKGEIPVTENITSRGQWVDTDIIAVTNILNEIMSADPAVKAQGLEDVAYILPIFMVNSMKGDELLVYLKAKLEAAKQVKKNLDKESEIMEKLKGKEEEVLVDLPKKEEKPQEKTLSMSESLPEPKDEPKDQV